MIPVNIYSINLTSVYLCNPGYLFFPRVNDTTARNLGQCEPGK